MSQTASPILHKNHSKPKQKPSIFNKTQVLKNKKISNQSKTQIILKNNKNKENLNKPKKVSKQSLKETTALLKQYHKLLSAVGDIQLNRRQYEKQIQSKSNQDSQDDLLCLDQSIETLMNKRPNPYSSMSKYSNDLPIIEERIKSEEDKELIEDKFVKIIKLQLTQQKHSKQHHSTAATKRNRMLYDPFTRPFIQPCKLDVDVAQLLKKRRIKIKSSTSQKKDK